MPPKKAPGLISITSSSASVCSVASNQGSKQSRSRGEKTTWKQRYEMCNWLSHSSNFAWITGSATTGLKHPVAGTHLNKKTAYADLAEYVNQKCGTKWDQKSGESRYKGYVKLYKETANALKDVNGAKYCLGPDDIGNGISSIESDEIRK